MKDFATISCLIGVITFTISLVMMGLSLKKFGKTGNPNVVTKFPITLAKISGIIIVFSMIVITL